MRKIDNLIKITRELKKKFQTGQFFHATIALKGGNIIAVGINDYNEKHPESKFGKYIATKNSNANYQPCLHSEIDCLKQIKFRDDLNKITLLNIRINNNDELANAEPCDNCKKVLSNYKFKRIYFTINNNTIGRLINNNY